MLIKKLVAIINDGQKQFWLHRKMSELKIACVNKRY